MAQPSGDLHTELEEHGSCLVTTTAKIDLVVYRANEKSRFLAKLATLLTKEDQPTWSAHYYRRQGYVYELTVSKEHWSARISNSPRKGAELMVDIKGHFVFIDDPREVLSILYDRVDKKFRPKPAKGSRLTRKKKLAEERKKLRQQREKEVLGASLVLMANVFGV